MNTISKIILGVIIIGTISWLTVFVAAALTPFILAAVVAYIASPVAEKIERRGWSPTAVSSLIVFTLMVLLLLLPLAILPLIVAQVRDLTSFLPTVMDKVETWLGYDIATWLQQGDFDIKSIIGADGAQKTATIAAGIFGSGIKAIVSFFSILLITPLATFYFVRDRRSFGGELTDILPPYYREKTLLISRDLDGVLSEFLHGQLMVMSIMAIFYSVVLKLTGLDFALTIGVISGLLVFIPYVGFFLGLSLATIVGLGSFDSWVNIGFVWLLMGIGTVAESLFLTPRLIGERIGLHPLVVLLSLMVMGKLFGFIGVLVSLPVAATLLVCGRHLRRYYIGSNFYGQKQDP